MRDPWEACNKATIAYFDVLLDDLLKPRFGIYERFVLRDRLLKLGAIK